MEEAEELYTNISITFTPQNFTKIYSTKLLGMRTGQKFASYEMPGPVLPESLPLNGQNDVCESHENRVDHSVTDVIDALADNVEASMRPNTMTYYFELNM